MANVAARIRWAYEGERIPYDTFVSGVPFALRGHEDNQVLPFLGTVKAPDGTQAKWIRFSEFLPFEDACKVYWMDKENSKYPLYLYVMPYAPLQDSAYLYELLDSPPGGDEEGVPHMMEGHAQVANGVNISFRVVNSNLLWSKAQQYNRLQGIANPLLQHLHKMDACIADLTIEQGDNLLLAADEARGRLVLALMEQFTSGMEESDPHDAILSIYPQMHYQIYTNICPCCELKQQYTEYLSESVWNRLELARTELHERLQVNDRLSICQEEFNLMAAEGALVVHNCLSQTNNALYLQIRAQLEELRNKTMNDTLAGVLSDYEDGNRSEEVNNHPEEH